MKISISVMAHPSRAEFFPYLREKLGDIPFAIDEEGKGVWANRKKALALRDPKADFHLIVQDDAIICDDFLKKAKDVLDGVGKGGMIAVSFYYGRQKLKQKEALRGLHHGYVLNDWLTWGLAVCLPTKIIPGMIEFCDKMKMPQDDHRIARFLKLNNIKVYYPIPSLINHRIGKSLVNDPGENRVAYKYIDE